MAKAPLLVPMRRPEWDWTLGPAEVVGKRRATTTTTEWPAADVANYPSATPAITDKAKRQRTNTPYGLHPTGGRCDREPWVVPAAGWRHTRDSN